jgi:hypothetical protein
MIESISWVSGPFQLCQFSLSNVCWRLYMILESRRCGRFWIVQVVNSLRWVWMSVMFLVRLEHSQN